MANSNSGSSSNRATPESDFASKLKAAVGDTKFEHQKDSRLHLKERRSGSDRRHAPRADGAERRGLNETMADLMAEPKMAPVIRVKKKRTVVPT